MSPNTHENPYAPHTLAGAMHEVISRYPLLPISGIVPADLTSDLIEATSKAWSPRVEYGVGVRRVTHNPITGAEIVVLNCTKWFGSRMGAEKYLVEGTTSGEFTIEQEPHIIYRFVSKWFNHNNDEPAMP